MRCYWSERDWLLELSLFAFTFAFTCESLSPCCSCAAPAFSLQWVANARLAYVSDGELARFEGALDAALEALAYPLLQSTQAAAVETALLSLHHIACALCTLVIVDRVFNTRYEYEYTAANETATSPAASEARSDC